MRYGFGREKPGIEIPVNARFDWAGRDVRIPAVYSFAKGLIIDVAMATDTQTMRDFLAKWAPGGRARYSDFNKLDRMRIRYENPTSFLFKVTAIVNGRELHYESASGNGWAPHRGLGGQGRPRLGGALRPRRGPLLAVFAHTLPLEASHGGENPLGQALGRDGEDTRRAPSPSPGRVRP